jgi:hypothetical protein
VVPYNYDRVATYAELGDLIKGHLDATGASRVRSVGIMYHTPNRYNLKCFASDPEKSTVSGSLESFEPFRRFVVALRGAYGVEDVDLVSCDVVSAESSVLSALDFNGARVNASTNTTGQVKQGPVGDWVLEAGNVNLIGRYFNEKITQVDIALNLLKFDGNNPYRSIAVSASGDANAKAYIDRNPNKTPHQIMQYLNTPESARQIPVGYTGPGGGTRVYANSIVKYRDCRKKPGFCQLGDLPSANKFTPGANGVGVPQK